VTISGGAISSQSFGSSPPLPISVDVTSLLVGTVELGSFELHGINNLYPVVGAGITSEIDEVDLSTQVNQQITSVLLQSNLGALDFITNASFGISGVSATLNFNDVEVSIDVDVSITGVQADWATGTLTYITDVNLAITGQEIATSVGPFELSTEVNLTLDSVSVTGSTGVTDFISTNILPIDGTEFSALIGELTLNIVNFDYDAVKELYDRQRTVYVDSQPDTIIYIEPQASRTVYIDQKNHVGRTTLKV